MHTHLRKTHFCPHVNHVSVARPSLVFTAGRRPFDIHDAATAFHAAEADGSQYGRVTLLHIPLALLKYFSSDSHEIHPSPLHTHTHTPIPIICSCCESQPNFISRSYEWSASPRAVLLSAPVFLEQQRMTSYLFTAAIHERLVNTYTNLRVCT